MRTLPIALLYFIIFLSTTYAQDHIANASDFLSNSTDFAKVDSRKELALDKQVAVVWGASQGIGAAIAKKLGEEGATVILLARNKDKLVNVTEEMKALGHNAFPIVADITDESAVVAVTQEIYDLCRRIDILVQNVGIYPRNEIEEMPMDFFRTVIETNVTSSVNALKAVVPFMKHQNYGRILLVSSITGNKSGIPGLSAYSASKGALSGLIKTLAIELAPFGITINTIEPGLILTEGIASEALNTTYFDKVKQSVPIGRLGSSDEVAFAGFFLLHPNASYITGTTLVVDGGLTLPESHYLHVKTK